MPTVNEKRTSSSAAHQGSTPGTSAVGNSSGASSAAAKDQGIDYKSKYRNLKRKLQLLIYENETYQEELRKAQQQLLQVDRDNNFLLDRLMAYETVDDDTTDSDATESSDSDQELPSAPIVHAPKEIKMEAPPKQVKSETTSSRKRKAPASNIDIKPAAASLNNNLNNSSLNNSGVFNSTNVQVAVSQMSSLPSTPITTGPPPRKRKPPAPKTPSFANNSVTTTAVTPSAPMTMISSNSQSTFITAVSSINNSVPSSPALTSSVKSRAASKPSGSRFPGKPRAGGRGAAALKGEIRPQVNTPTSSVNPISIQSQHQKLIGSGSSPYFTTISNSSLIPISSNNTSQNHHFTQIQSLGHSQSNMIRITTANMPKNSTTFTTLRPIVSNQMVSSHPPTSIPNPSVVTVASSNTGTKPSPSTTLASIVPKGQTSTNSSSAPSNLANLTSLSTSSVPRSVSGTTNATHASNPTSTTTNMTTDIQQTLSSEEIEKLLDKRRQPQLLTPEKTPLTVPMDIFSNDTNPGPDNE